MSDEETPIFEDEEQFKRFVMASDHRYECQCKICREWWGLVGPEPEDD